MTWWDTKTFHAYERACGDAPGTRSRILAASGWQTRVVDLSLSEVDLWRGVRRSYKSLIHTAEREYIISPVNGGCIYSAMKIHKRQAGRMTRPIETWAMMGEWVRDGHGVLMCAGVRRAVEITMAHDEWPLYAPIGLIDMRAYVYCTIYKATAYYFSSVSPAKNLNHALIWHAMKELKARGVRWFELGWMAREDDTEKDRGISHFKRGFGGFDVPANKAPRLCE